MKNIKITLLATFFVSIFLSVNAQEWDPTIYQVGKKYPGYVIKLTGDTVHGFIEAKSRCSNGGLGYSNQNRCEFYLNEKDRKPLEKYDPKEIKGYMIADKYYQSIPYSGGLFKKNNFCLAVKKGRLTLYEWYSTKEGFSTMRKNTNESWKDFDARRYSTSQVLMHQEGTDVVSWEALIFKFSKKMGELTADYPELSNKVKNGDKGYGMLKVYDIIDEYNQHFEGAAAEEAEEMVEEGE